MKLQSRSWLTGGAGLLVLSCGSLAAQREQPTFKLGAATLVLDHGVPPYGKHGLDELPPGKTWRLGSNEATTLHTDFLILAGEALIAPGQYRAQIHRGESGGFALQLDYARWALGEPAEGNKASRIAATPGEGDPVEKLAIEWRPDERGEGERGGQPVTMRVRFGPHVVDAPLELFPPAACSAKLGSWSLAGYPLPADVVVERLKQDHATVVATLRPKSKVSGRKSPPFFNVVLRKEGGKVVPALRAPVDSFGFAALEPFDAEWTQDVKVEWKDGRNPTPAFVITEASVRRHELCFSFLVGERMGIATVPLPKKP